MTRPLAFLTALFALATAPLAQEAAPQAHALPFASEGNLIELAVGGAPGVVRVGMVEAPTWARFAQSEVEASSGEGEPVARLVFGVAPEAPVGEAAEIVLEVRGADGRALASKTVRVVVAAPEAFALEPPRPNPSRGGAVVPFVLPEEADVRLSVLDVLGREVAVLVDGARGAGAHSVRVPALASGVYVVRLVVDGGREAAVRRLTIAR